MFQNVQDVFAARLAILVENEKLEVGEANIAVHAIKVLVENSDPDELATALENAMWMDNTIREVGPPPARGVPMVVQATDDAIAAGASAPWQPAEREALIREGVDNDSLTDAEATAALNEQSS